MDGLHVCGDKWTFLVTCKFDFFTSPSRSRQINTKKFTTDLSSKYGVRGYMDGKNVKNSLKCEHGSLSQYVFYLHTFFYEKSPFLFVKFSTILIIFLYAKIYISLIMTNPFQYLILLRNLIINFSTSIHPLSINCNISLLDIIHQKQQQKWQRECET